MKTWNQKEGFTLIEILLVIGILGVIVVMGTDMFFSILKGSTKTHILTEVKQNGNYALGVMERMIRNAREITGNCGEGMESIRIRNPDLNETTFVCLDIGTEEGRISSGSGVSGVYKRLTSDRVRVDSCSFDCQAGEEGVRPDTVSIRFSLSQAAAEVRPEEEATIDFQTTVTLRNF